MPYAPSAASRPHVEEFAGFVQPSVPRAAPVPYFGGYDDWDALGAIGSTPPPPADQNAIAFAVTSSASGNEIAKWEQQAREFEGRAEWDKACEIYESILRIDRSISVIKERHQHCLRRYWQARRHRGQDRPHFEEE